MRKNKRNETTKSIIGAFENKLNWCIEGNGYGTCSVKRRCSKTERNTSLPHEALLPTDYNCRQMPKAHRVFRKCV